MHLKMASSTLPAMAAIHVASKLSRWQPDGQAG